MIFINEYRRIAVAAKYFDYGVNAIKANDFINALSWLYRNVLEIEHSHRLTIRFSECFLLIGYCYLNLRRYDIAIKYIDRYQQYSADPIMLRLCNLYKSNITFDEGEFRITRSKDLTSPLCRVKIITKGFTPVLDTVPGAIIPGGIGHREGPAKQARVDFNWNHCPACFQHKAEIRYAIDKTSGVANFNAAVFYAADDRRLALDHLNKTFANGFTDWQKVFDEPRLDQLVDTRDFVTIFLRYFN